MLARCQMNFNKNILKQLKINTHDLTKNMEYTSKHSKEI